MKLTINELRALNSQMLTIYGHSAKEIEVLQNILLYAQLRGDSQSFLQFTSQERSKHNPEQAITVEKETKLSAHLNGHGQEGMLVLYKAMEMAHIKAKEHGFGIVGTKGCREGTGAIGFYVEELAKKGLIGWAFSGSTKQVTPFGSFQPLFSTNPLAISFPTQDDPIVLDMSTAIAPFFKVIEAQIAGKQLPTDSTYHVEGELTMDPTEALQGAIRGLDFGPQGFGLCLVVEALTGPLVGATLGQLNEGDQNHGNLIFAFDPELITDSTLFKEKMSQLKDAVKNSKALHNIQEVLVPGETGQRQAKQALIQGYIEIDDSVYHLFKQKLHALQASLDDQNITVDQRVILDDTEPM